MKKTLAKSRSVLDLVFSEYIDGCTSDELGFDSQQRQRIFYSPVLSEWLWPQPASCVFGILAGTSLDNKAADTSDFQLQVLPSTFTSTLHYMSVPAA